MNRKETDLTTFENRDFDTGRSFFVRAIWYSVNAALISSALPGSRFRTFLLRIFGAKVGTGVVIKPRVNIKYPWKLTIGGHVWVGEGVWIDNIDGVYIADHVCISQGAMLMCGNHNYKKSTFDLITKKITLEKGVWIGAKAIVAPGVIAGSHSVLMAGSVATGKMDDYTIYRGNPAVAIKPRAIE